MSLTQQDRSRYEWQLWIRDFGEAGQERLKNASVLVSRCGGVGSPLAYELAAAGVGHLVIPHGGTLRVDDLNRQLLMSHDGIGRPRVDLIAERLQQYNPDVKVTKVEANVNEANIDDLVRQVDLVASCAPLFRERLLMNRAAVQHGKPLVDCAMFEMHAHITTILPGQTPCLACLYPEEPAAWKREFPVLGAVSGTTGCLGATEVIKVLANFGEPLCGRMLLCDLRTMDFRKVNIQRKPNCLVCGRL